MYSEESLPEKKDINHPRSIAMLVWVITVAYLFMLFMPGLLGGFVDQAGFTETQAGYLCSMNLFGMMIGALIAVGLVQKANLRSVLLGAGTLMLVTEIVSGSTQGFTPLMVIRFFNGISLGIASGMAGPGVSSLRNPDQAVAIACMLQYFLAAVGLTVLPYLYTGFGMGGAFYLLAGFALTIILLIKWFPVPVNVEPKTKQTCERPSLFSLPIILSLTALLIFYIANSSLWAYLDRIGVAAGIPVETVGFNLSVSMLAAIVTGILAVVINVRLGRAFPLALGFVGMIAGSALLVNTPDSTTFLIAASMFNGSWMFVLTYFIGFLAVLDPLGRLVVLSNFAMAAGLAVGPGLGGIMIKEGTYTVLLFMSISGFTLALIMVITAIWMSGRKPLPEEITSH